jgi:predicted esterase YcpF (UPF0227 family)
MPSPLLIYFHGFLSSPGTHKAALLATYLRAHELAIELQTPALPDNPAAALAAAEAAIIAARANGYESIGVLGSSMGGFYATILAQRYGLRAVLINPAVQPQRFVAANLGRQRNPYTEIEFTLDGADVEVLQRISPELSRPELFWLLQQMGDEVLDYRDAVNFYAGCRQTVEPGGNHRFQDFERYLPDIITFLGACA